MKKQQLILISGGLTLLVILLAFGRTTPNKKIIAPAISTNHIHEVTTEELLISSREKLNSTQLNYLSGLENSIKRGDIKAQQLKVYHQLATFWQDSVMIVEPYLYYTGQAAKLENTEKTLTFAAHLFLNNLKTESEMGMQHWLATNAKDLFNRALQINPADDSSKIGLGACYIFGNLSDNPMEGIGIIREVVQRNPGNTFGQLILGLGGVKSGQYAKAIERFKIVLAKEPDNLEAMLNIAEVYDRQGEKGEAVKWYRQVKGKITNPKAIKELDNRIKALL